jgi:type I restriction enzyme, S subunit
MIKPLCTGYQLSTIVGITEVPKHWEEKEIKYCLRDGSEGIKIGPFGSALKSEMLVDSGYKVYGQENLIRNSFEIGNRFITEERFQELAAYEIKPGDVLISMMGTIGKCKVVPRDIQRGIMDSHLIRLSFDESVVLSEFVALLIQEAFYINTQLKLNSKGSIMSGLNSSIIKNLKILIPTIEEQKLILEYINTKKKQLDGLILKKNQLLKLLEEKRQSIITESVTKGLNPNVRMKDSGVEWIGEIPAHWEVNKVGYLGRLQNGISKSAEEFGFGAPFVSYGDVYKNMFLPQEVNGLVNSSEEEQEIYSVREGDVFFTRTSETVDEIGIASTCLQTIEKATFAGFLIRFRTNSTKLLPTYSKYYFRSNLGRRYFVKEVNLVTRASLGQGLLRNFPVILPSLKEQRDISEYLDNKTTAIDKSVSLIKNQIQKLKEYRQSLIYEAVTGKIDVHDFEVVS